MMTGGHGWSSNWKQIDEVKVAATIESLASLNRGGPWSSRGSYYCQKKVSQFVPPEPLNQAQPAKLKFVIFNSTIIVGIITLITYCLIDFIFNRLFTTNPDDTYLAYLAKAIIFSFTMGFIFGVINWDLRFGQKKHF